MIRQYAMNCLLAVVGLSLLSAFGSAVQAQMPKQGKYDVMNTYQLTLLESQKFGDYSLNVFHAEGIQLNKAGSGFLHNVSYVCHIVTIPGSFRGYCVATDLDGDHIYSEISLEGSGAVGTTGGGRRSTFTGGTGKYVGIQGGCPYQAIYAPKIGDKLVGHTECSGEYKLP